MGGNLSHEFMVPAESGEDIILCCPDCGFLRSQTEGPSKCPNCSNELQKLNTIEVGHIFQLGTKYSKIFKAEILDQRGDKKPIIMGCYGIGVSRLIPAILEQNYDENGIIWPGEVAPFDIIILPLEVGKKKVYETGLNVYNNLKKRGFEVLLDDRDERAGIKFKDADLVGIPIQVIIGEKFLKENKIELKIRRSGERVAMAERKLSEEIGKHLSIK
jgi:prolyl-tRNA synthetase